MEEAQLGDKVKILSKENAKQGSAGEKEGILMPDEKDFAVLKLDSGYNIGIAKQNIAQIKIIEKKKPKPEQSKAKISQKALPRVTILHTGGTIASKVDYETGGVVAKFSPEEILKLFPELSEIAAINSKLISNIFSENITFSEYNTLAKEIEKEISSGARAIIITHGTDTLHYTSSALSFMVQNAPIPIILVGSQRSSDRPSTDSALNLISAVFFALKTNLSGVFACMHETIDDENCIIFNGANCRKMHSSRRDAFKQINSLPIARVNFSERKIDFLRKEFEKKNSQSENKNEKSNLKISFMKENIKIGFLKTHPNMISEEVLAFKGFDGVVVEGTGLGHIPESQIANLKELIKSGTVIAIAPQTIYGRIDLNVYSTGRKLIDAGVIGNYCDMTPETAFIKLAWLLSNYPKEKAKELYEKSFAGEISEKLSNIASDNF